MSVVKKALRPLYGPVLGLIVDGKKGLLRGLGNAATAFFGGPMAALASVVSQYATMLQKKPGLSGNATDRLYASLDPNATRKMVFGGTAMATDVVYQTYTGTKQEFYHQILCVASHQVGSIDQIWFDNELAWKGTAQGRFAGYLTIATKLVGVSGAGIAIDNGWTANHSLTGCAYIHLRFKLTGNSKKAESPFSQSVPTRVTIRGTGALVYDPRLDTTVTGGSGTQRANDQATWAYGASSGRNPALQLLWYLLGWKINGKLAVGRGIPAERIDLASFITAANICDESVTLAAGGTEPRYRADGVFSEGDAPSTVIGNLEAAMNGRLRDAGGKIALLIFKNDLAAPTQSFTEADIIGGDLWRQTPSIEETFNVVRGRFVDASDNALYQLAEYPEAVLASTDGIERIDTFDLPTIQSPSQAQRLAKTRLQRRQYGGTFSATFNAKAWTVTLGDIVQLSHAAMGWTNKLFRVTRHGIAVNGQVALELSEEHSDIYAWASSESAAVVAAAPTVYDPLNHPLIAGIDDAGSGVSAQLLWDDTFVSSRWTIPTPAGRIAWANSRRQYAATVPFVEATDFRIYASGDLAGLPRTQAGKALFIRAIADPNGFAAIQVVDDDGAIIVDTGGVYVHDAVTATFNLEVAIRWLNSNGTFHSRTIIKTLLPGGGLQIVQGSAQAPVTGFGVIEFGYPSQTAKTGGWVVYEPWVAEYEPTADVTTSIVGITDIVVQADHVGVIATGQLPRNDSYKLLRNGVSVAATWSLQVLSGGYAGTVGASTGVLNTTGLTTKTATVRLSAAFESTTRTFDVKVNRNDAPPPSGGGGTTTTGGTTSSANSFTAFSGTAMAVVATLAPVTVSGAGKVRLTLSASPLAAEAAPAGLFDVAAIFQRDNGGIWEDVGLETASDPDSQVFYEAEFAAYFSTEGSLSVDRTVSGLTAGSSQTFRLRARVTNGPKNMTMTGTIAADGTVA